MYLVGESHPYQEGKRVLFPLAQAIGVPRFPVDPLQTGRATGHQRVDATRKPQRDLAPEHRHHFFFAAQDLRNEAVHLRYIERKQGGVTGLKTDYPGLKYNPCGEIYIKNYSS